MECCGRPNRSDIHLSAEEEAKLEAKAREYFDETAPKRHTKPQRSEYSSRYVDDLPNDKENKNDIPELVEFQRLENDPQVRSKNISIKQFFVVRFYMRLPGVEPGSSAWKAIILTVGLQTLPFDSFCWH
jgi:hypothetical protein